MATRTISNAGGNWNSVGTWVEAAVPTAADEVVATLTSGNLTIDTSAVCRSINLTNYTGVFTIPTSLWSLTIGDATAGTGNIALKFVNGMTFTCPSGPISFVSTSATQQTVDFGGKVMGDITFNGVGGSWLLSSSSTINPQNSLTLSNGILNTNNLNHTWGAFLSNNGNIRTFTMGTSQITLNCNAFNIGSSAFAWDTNGVTNLTLTANTATIKIVQDYMNPDIVMRSGTLDFTGASLELLGSGIATTTFSGTVTFANVTRTGTRHTTDGWLLNTTGPTITNSLTINGFDPGHRLLIYATSSKTFTVTGATVTCSNVDFFNITMSPAQNLSAITGGSGDAGGNSGITFTTSDDLFFYAPTAGPAYWSDISYWFLATGGTGGLANRIPLPQDNALFDGSSCPVPGVNIIADQPRLGQDIDFTGITSDTNIHFNCVSSNYGSFVLDTDMSISAVGNVQFIMRGHGTGNTFDLKMAGHTWPTGGFSISTAGTNTVDIQDDFATLGAFALTALVNTNNHNVTASSLAQTSGTFTMGSSTITLTGTGTVWSASGTISAGTSLIKLTNTARDKKTFAGGSKTYNNIELAGTQMCEYAITGSNTFSDIKSSNAVSHKILFAAGSTTTLTTFTVNGTINNRIFLKSTSGAGYTLTKSGGGTITSDYLIVQNSTVTPGATWSVTNSVDGGNNSGWTGFTTQPFTWTGAIDNNWSTTGNWQGGSVPGVNNLALFIGTFDIAATMDVAVNCRGIYTTSDYTQTITQAANVTLGELGWYQSGGDFVGATQTFTTGGDLIYVNGTFTPSTGNTIFNGTIDQFFGVIFAWTNSDIFISKTVGTSLKFVSQVNMLAGQNLTVTTGKLDFNGNGLTINGTLTVNDSLRSSGTDLAYGTLVVNPTTSTVEFFGNVGASNPLNFYGITYNNLTLPSNQVVFITAGTTITINGTLASNAYQALVSSGVGSGQCKLRSTVLGQKWFLILNGPCTVGNTLDIQDCDSTGGKWFKAPQSIYELSHSCTTTENKRCILP